MSDPALDRQLAEPARGRPRLRLWLLIGLLLIWGGGIVYRLYRLQIVQHDLYSARAERQQQRIVHLDAPRGTIYDARGRELAVSVEVESAFAVPSEMDPEELEATADRLARVLDVDRGSLLSQLRSDRDFVWLARKLEPSESAALRELDVEGVSFLPESKRYYPFGEVAAQVLGFVGTDNLGLAGLESEYDAVISGKTATRTVLRDQRGRFLDLELSFTDAEPGEDLHLTLDASLQFLAEKSLRRAIERTGARAGSVVLLDARDSSVLAMASYPTFDPNRFTSFDEASWRNRPVTDAFEPGSTFKLVTAAAALEEGAVRTSDLFDCERGGIALQRAFIRDYKPFGVMTFRDVFAKSSNVGTIKAALRVGSNGFYRMMESFGFGVKTGIDLPGESAGILRPWSRWNELATAYGSFGQGLSVTSIQLANAYAAVGRGGELARPYVLAARGRNGEVRPRKAPIERHRSVTEPTARVLMSLLESVVVDGTGGAAAIPGYRVAGKTGTAEKSDPSGYSETGRVASFVGLAPAQEPRIVGLVVLDEPDGTMRHGGDVAAPVFSEVVEGALLYLGVPPSRDDRVLAGGRSPRWLRWPRSEEERRVAELSSSRLDRNEDPDASL